MRRFALFLAALALVTLTKTDAACGRNFYYDRSGVISHTRDSNDNNCKWNIEVGSGFVIKFVFNFEKRETSITDVCYDVDVEIYDILSNGERFLRQELCTEYLGTLTSSSSKVDVIYKGGRYKSLGFSISWTRMAKPHHAMLVGKYGSLSSPNYPSPYPDGLHKKWEIIVPFGQNIRLQFDNFYLDKGDYLEIFDITYNNEMISKGRWYGSKSPNIIRSDGTRLFVEFYSDGNAIKGSGFHAVWNPSSSCGGNFTTSGGLLSTPNYPSVYQQKDRVCKWIIAAGDGYVIRLNFLPILELGQYDYLKVYDLHMRGKVVLYDSAKLSTDRIPRPIVSSSSTIEVQLNNVNYRHVGIGFSAYWAKAAAKACEAKNGTCFCDTGYTKQGSRCVDINECVYNNGACEQVCTNEAGSWKCSCHSGFTARGFKCSKLTATTMRPTQLPKTTIVTTTDTKPACGGVYRSSQGEIKTNNYPSNYPDDLECTWEIQVDKGESIMLMFKSPFAVEKRIKCDADFIEVFDISYTGVRTSKGKWCGNDLPPILKSNTSRMAVVFHSDKSKNYAGFHAVWDVEPVCSETLSNQEGSFSSLNYPIEYPMNTYCRWEINPGSGAIITLTFKPLFDLEDGTDCAWDYVQVFSGNVTLGKWCGNNRPKTLTSNGEKMVVIFKSDKSNGGKGFFASWVSL